MAPKPRMLPAATLTLAAAFCVFWGAPEPVGEAPLSPAASLPEASAPLAEDGVGGESRTVLLLSALMVIVRDWLSMEPVPCRVKVWTPGPTAGMSAGRGCVVTAAGCVVTAAGWEVTTEGWPVTTPRELVRLV